MPCELLPKSFECSSNNRSFHQQASFETAYVLILKLGLFKPTDILALHECHPLLLHLLCACIHLCYHDFLWLAEYYINWANQEALSNDKAYAVLACLLHYKLSVANKIRFLGNNYTGKYHDIPLIVALFVPTALLNLSSHITHVS